MVEGAPSPARVHDPEDYPLKIVKHLLGRDAHGHESHVFQISITRRVPFRAIASIVRFAIDLDRQACRHACEVEREWSLRALLPEPVSTGPLLQRPP
jgi:hypothetical protein